MTCKPHTGDLHNFELIVKSFSFSKNIFFSFPGCLGIIITLVLQPAVELKYVNMFLSLVGGVGSMINDKQLPGEVSLSPSTCRGGRATLSLAQRPPVVPGGPRRRHWRGRLFPKKRGCPTC